MYAVNMASRTADVKRFSYTDDILRQLAVSLSEERLTTYLDAADGDRKQAIRLHVLNTGISAAFYGPLQGLEVALRNAMHRSLAGVYGETWYDNRNAELDAGAREQIVHVRARLTGDGRADDPHRIVAALSFGFWVALLRRGGPLGDGRRADYEMTLWRPALRGAFPHRASLNRKQAHQPLDALRLFRNRIAHHEPIFPRDLAEDHDRILEVVGWISPETRRWIAHHSRVPRLLQTSRYAGASAF